jgi:hypothetical protein
MVGDIPAYIPIHMIAADEDPICPPREASLLANQSDAVISFITYPIKTDEKGFVDFFLDDVYWKRIAAILENPNVPGSATTLALTSALGVVTLSALF